MRHGVVSTETELIHGWTGVTVPSVDRTLTPATSAAWSARLLSVLRVVAGFLFIAHGLQKLFGFPVDMPGPPVALLSQIGIAGLLEAIGGMLLMLGLFTRVVAFVLAGQMAFAYFIAHASRGFWPIANGGELAALYCFLFLFLAVAGGGPWSADAFLKRLRR